MSTTLSADCIRKKTHVVNELAAVWRNATLGATEANAATLLPLTGQGAAGLGGGGWWWLHDSGGGGRGGGGGCWWSGGTATDVDCGAWD